MSNDKLSASLEDYLEAIYHLVREHRVARVKDIATRLDVHKSSVTGALHALADRELIHYEPYGFVTMTDRGRGLGAEIVRRHEILRDFFVNVLEVNADTAERAACRMEHALPRSIVTRLSEFSEFLDKCPRAGDEWIRKCWTSYGANPDPAECEACVERCRTSVLERRAKEEAEVSE